MKTKLIQQGAEAKIFLNEKENFLIKDRIPKSYRHPSLDKKIIKQRTKSEKKLLEKASKIINAPNPLPLKEFNQINMPFINGKKLSEHLDNFSLKEQKQIMKIVGKNTALLHKNNIIHGDLTTSNMILTDEKSDFEKQLEEVKKLNLPIGSYALFGSAPLGIRGIRRCQDIDIVVNEELWIKYKNKSDWKYNLTKNGIEYLSKGIIEFWHNWLPWNPSTNGFIKDAEIINGFPFVKLKYFIEWKTKFGREKDKRDIQLIKNYLNQKESINYPKKVFFIDFGLGFISQKTEDKAVDIHLLKQALEAKHFKNWETLFTNFKKQYGEVLGKKEAENIFKRLSAVEKRGRYRH